MHPMRKRKLINILIFMVLISLGLGLVLSAFKENLNLYKTPSELIETPLIGQNIRLGGMVVPGSIKREGLKVIFDITDTLEALTVEYEGILPDLFKENSGVVAEGRLTQPRYFIAHTILAKHDEQYMPPKITEPSL